MAVFKTNIQGLAQLKAKLDNYSKQLSTDVDGILSDGAMSIAANARARAPKGNQGKLPASIRADVSIPFNKTIEATAPYAAFVEFGTGSRVFENKIGFDFTPEIREFAKEFYVNGMGRLPASPFMFPALEQGKVQIIREVKQLLGL